ncbi:glycosyltransferase family 5 protein [Polychaeton citri CBS 116435]|uniref:alpha-1,3-glucan synthase n=1 Tax=Polychaeton citri CBS 116435 TaxID=1314669 RepID=A0A9P4QCQ0_9PEZI|nr:glycosyltransferase family 5 protein [Polychaeton citri CBS 116435]
MFGARLLTIASLATCSFASHYDEAEVDWNLNTNKDASDPLEFSVTWDNHVYHPSPDNWRFPFYSFFPDRFVNGDPSNDNANGTSWEHDISGTQLRHGGDLQGIVDSLDYLQGLGIKAIYIAGSLFINSPWEADSFSPLDHTILDHHFGNIDEVRDAIQKIHDRGIYVVLDNTMSTMGDLFAFQGYANSSAPWSFTEHHMDYKTDRVYRDFEHSNNYLSTCDTSYPVFYDQGGNVIHDENTTQMIGCMDSDFNQYGDVGAFGVYPEWQKQLSKFNGVQDRLRDWKPSVLAKIIHFSCLAIQGLDIDGFRIDKAMQVTVEGQSNFSHAMRECASKVGKNNFFIPGEVVNGNADGAIYLGRGKQPAMQYPSIEQAAWGTANNSDFIRDDGYSGLDAGAFQYTFYRGLMRFLGLDGDLLAANDLAVNFVEQWNGMMLTNDFSNAYDGHFDPRHLYGVSNQDVLRWPGLTNGTERQLLGDFLATLLMPGIPLKSWGEEQAMYVLDNTASNYIYGRQSMSSAQAWQMHGCYKVGDTNLNDAPFNSSYYGCQDDWNSLDHRDPSHPVYAVLKQMYQLRQRYPVLNDGWRVQQLSNQTFNYTLPGSFDVPTETGLFSVARYALDGVPNQNFTQGHGNTPVWLLYTNFNGSDPVYEADCSSDGATIAPYDTDTTVKNLFYPFDEYTLETSTVKYNIQGSDEYNGCLRSLNMTHYGWKAFVPKGEWQAPSPLITRFSPGHDARILSNTSSDEAMSLDLELRFSAEMDCDSVRNSINVSSTTDSGKQAVVDLGSFDCKTVDPQFEAYFYGPPPSIWRAQFKLDNVYDGVHTISTNNATNAAKDDQTNSRDNFMIRVGQAENPMVFPMTANYSSTLLFKDDSKTKRAEMTSGSGLYINHKAAGADKWRYSMSFGAEWSDWMNYVPGNASLDDQTWTGQNRQKWSGDHVQVQYWSSKTGSSDHIIQGDLVGYEGPEVRRFPHIFLHGPFNQYGYDSGIPNRMEQLDNGTWKFDFMTEWPTQFQLNVWGMADNGQPDVSFVLGDVDNDTVVDRISPTSLEQAVTNITNLGPESPHLAWRILFNDGDLRYYLVPVGSRWAQLALWLLLGLIPVGTAIAGVYLYTVFFYGVKFNQIGLSEKKGILPTAANLPIMIRQKLAGDKRKEKDSAPPTPAIGTPRLDNDATVIRDAFTAGAHVESQRKTVLIGTMEYDISDWNIKIKIGGLGVMAQLMGKNLQHQDLIWVVPCVDGIDYPTDTPGLPIDVTILGRTYEVQVQYHKLDNITYMLLDAPVFRRQTQKEPYPARMDDLDSAIYYSAWNQCLAEAMRRFPIDLYHINDYHGTVAPLYLLPQTIPCALSLHNAEFQGLWPMRNPREIEEICSVFNLPESVVQRYVQFGEVFNLLHAGASILRIHQKGFGAVGVSKKYGKRSWARYPIFWGLNKIGALPNPDPSDVAEWDKKLADPENIKVDEVFESARAGLKRQAQEWAGLEQRADADLFVFVGRWSMQKGIDLIADVFPNILEKHPHTQLLCVGPTIDLYGKFAALKLDKMMQKYPGRVYSKPEFTALPPFIFSGAEFALIPSRDEPFGLVAVEFGRKGALGVGSRVGGLGQMPGWWFTVESPSTKHMMHQFKMAIDGALKSDYETRSMMRARSAKQRFPVAQWKEDLEILQSTAIKIHKKRMERISAKRMGIDTGSATSSGWTTPNLPGWMTPRSGWATPTGFGTPRGTGTPAQSRPGTRPSSPTRSGQTTPSISRQGSLSLGLRHGPGHSPPTNVRSARSAGTSSRSSSRRNSLEIQEAERKRLSSIEDEAYITSERAEEAKRQSRLGAITQDNFNFELRDGTRSDLLTDRPREHNPFFSPAATPGVETPIGHNFPGLGSNLPSGMQTPLDTDRVMDEKSSKQPQDLTPFFTDPTGLYFKTFDKMLDNLSGKTSETTLCVEEYLEKSEKAWFNRLHSAKMARVQDGQATPAGSMFEGIETDEPMSQFLLPDNYEPPTGLKRILSTRIGDWPIYAFFIALGQILAANSYQIVLLTGQVGQSAGELYAIACIYLASSLIWWYMFRRLPSFYCISLPWFFYGFGFLLLGFAPYATGNGRAWVQYVATASYSIASAAGSIFFSQNFGSLGSAPVKSWAFRACAIQGTQQLYIVGLWYWGTVLTGRQAKGYGAASLVTYGSEMTAIGLPIAFFLWAIGAVLWVGLPDFYRQKPGAVPSFYSSAFRRKIVLWFLFAVFVQNIFLSAPYGRNWAYLWSSKHAAGWVIFLLIVLFFIIIWAAILYYFSRLSITHSWILPMFAVGLGAPRWCQILWSCSNIGTYLPWAGGPVASAVLSRGLWLWLGVLDSLQGVGLGMILLQTLSRFHITFALVAAQVIGSIGTIIARADGLNSVGPGDTFPSFAAGYGGLANGWFWVGMFFQLIICGGYFLYFRREQLSKP